MNAGDWITNHPGSLKSFWPRRQEVRYSEGVARATPQYTSEQLAAMNIVGVYLDHDCPDYWERELVYPDTFLPPTIYDSNDPKNSRI
jgi:hypothetical protein